MTTDTDNATSCSMGKQCSGINYCFWAKLLVALPAVPLLGAVAASFFTAPAWQFAAASYAGAGAVWIASEIDRIPALRKKFKKQI